MSNISKQDFINQILGEIDISQLATIAGYNYWYIEAGTPAHVYAIAYIDSGYGSTTKTTLTIGLGSPPCNQNPPTSTDCIKFWINNVEVSEIPEEAAGRALSKLVTLGRPPPCGDYGDVDGDGYVTMDDIEEAGTVWGPVTTEKGRRADVNGDGTVDILDTILIRNYVQGEIDIFPVCEAPATICSWIDSIDVTNLTLTHALYVYALSQGAIISANRKYNELDPKPEELPIGIASWGNALGVYGYSQGAYSTGNRKSGCSY